MSTPEYRALMEMQLGNIAFKKGQKVIINQEGLGEKGVLHYIILNEILSLFAEYKIVGSVIQINPLGEVEGAAQNSHLLNMYRTVVNEEQFVYRIHFDLSYYDGVDVNGLSKSLFQLKANKEDAMENFLRGMGINNFQRISFLDRLVSALQRVPFRKQELKPYKKQPTSENTTSLRRTMRFNHQTALYENEEKETDTKKNTKKVASDPAMDNIIKHLENARLELRKAHDISDINRKYLNNYQEMYGQLRKIINRINTLISKRGKIL